MRQRLMAPMFPDHDWVESDFESIGMRLDEGPARRLSAEQRLQRDFEKHYEKFLRLPAVRKLSPVDALRTFLRMHPRYAASSQPLIETPEGRDK